MAIDWKKQGQAIPTPITTPAPVPIGFPGGGVPVPKPSPGPEVRPGMFDINLTPGGFAATLDRNAQSTGDLLDNLNESIFGQRGLGQITGQLHFDNPLTDTIGNIGGVLGGAVGATLRAPFAAVSRVPLGWLPNGADEHFRNVRADAIARNVWTDQDESEWRTVDQAAAGDVLNGGNLKYNYLQDFSASQNEHDLFPMLSHGPAASLGGVLAQAFGGALQVPQALVERGIAGAAKWTSGMNRVQETLAMADAGYELNPAEQVVVQKIRDGSWSENDALDYMAGRHTGLSHDPLLQVLGGVASDPTLIAAGGTVGIARGAAAGARAASAVRGGFAIENLTGLQKFQIGLDVVAKSSLGRSAKVVRTIVDPLSAIGGNKSFTKGAVDLLSEQGTHAVMKSYGQGAINGAYATAARYGMNIDRAVSTYSGNLLRGYAAFRQRATLLKSANIDWVFDTVPDQALDDVIAASKSGFDEVVDYSDGVRKTVFSAEDDLSLANRMAELSDFGSRAPAEWADDIAKMSVDEKGLWHALTYGGTDDLFQIARRDALAGGKYAGKFDLDELVVLSDRNMDNVVAEGLAKSISGAMSLARKKEMIGSAIAQYPALRMVGDVPGTRGGIDRWLEELSKQIDARAFHSRLTAVEIKTMPDEIRQFVMDHPSWNIGFAPNDAVKWGVSFDEKGLPILTHAPHVGHVSMGAATFRPTADKARNALGQVIGPTAGRLLDPIEVASRTAAAQVSGLRLVRNFEQRFVREGVGVHGMTEGEGRKLFTAIKDLAFDTKTTMQGLTPGPVWREVESLIPTRLRGVLGKRDVFNMVMRASEGDLRIVGMTSKLTSRMRSMLVSSGATPGNMVGQISVNAYNLMRYTLNPIFIGQRMTDMPFFNILRGVAAHLRGIQPGSKLEEVQRVLRNMTDTSVMRNFGLENIEYRQHGDFAEIFTGKLSPAATRLERVAQAETRVIQSNQIEWVYRNMGNLVQDSLDDLQKLYPDATLPRTFDQLRVDYSNRAGRLLSDNEVGFEYLKEQFHAGMLNTPEGIPQLIEEGAKIMPGDLGELRPLNLDAIGAYLGFKDLKGLRSAMQASDRGPARIDLEAIEEYLNDWHYHPDQIERIKDGIRFEWDTYFNKLAVNMDLTKQESLRLQAIISSSARQKGMVPAEYLSQVVAHNAGKVGFKRGVEGLDEALRPTVELMRASMIGSERERVKALVDAVFPHLDRSAQQGLLVDFMADLRPRIQAAYNAGNAVEGQRLQLLLEDLKGGWGSAAKESFTDRILDRWGGAPAAQAETLPTHALSSDGYPRARYVQPEELDAMTARGQGLLTDLDAAQPSPLLWMNEAQAVPGEVLASARPMNDTSLGEAVQRLRPQDVRDPKYAVYDAYLSNHLSSLSRSWIGRMSDDQLDALATRIAVESKSPTIGGAQDWLRAHADEIQTADEFGLTLGKAGGVGNADYDSLVQRLHRSVIPKNAEEEALAAKGELWGGSTIDAHTMEEISSTGGTGQWFYHGAHKNTVARVRKTGVPGGDWIDDPNNPMIPKSANDVLYRTRRSNMVGGQEKAPGWWGGTRAPADALEVSTDNGRSWLPVTPKQGPYTGAVGSKGDWAMPIVDAEDPEAFGQMFDDFAKANAAELQKTGRQIGVFRNEGAKRIEFDVVTTVPTTQDAEALQLAVAQEQTGGWYNHAEGPNGNGIYRPAVRPRQPDVERAVQYVSDWVKKAYLPNEVADRGTIGRSLVDLSNRIPTTDAFAYNKTQAMALDLMRDNMNRVVMDSHRLADMSKSRSVFMRSLNHPLFGLYPASYMWGKVVPEFVRFVAQEPFGLRTGAMAYLLQDIQMSLAAQYELDPSFRETLEGIGNSETAFLLSYITPSFPWEDVSAGVAPGIRSFAERGPSAEIITRQLDMMSPNRWIRQTAGAVGELSDAISGALPKAPAASPTPAGPAGQLQGPLSESQSDLNEVLNRVFQGIP